MMKPFIISLIALCCFIDVQAQKVTRNYDNVTMSEALRDLNELSPDYTISFMYNELEDFRVTTSIKHKSVTDAAQVCHRCYHAGHWLLSRPGRQAWRA